MARALQDILTELNSVYNPQRDTYNQQLGTQDPQMQAETQGLEAQKRDSFQQITDQANRRGLFYSGLPIAEEQRYTGQQFLPAVANLRAKYKTQKDGLSAALAQLGIDQYKTGTDIWQKELDRDAEMERFNQQLAAQERARAASGSSEYDPTLGKDDGKKTSVNYETLALQDANDFLQEYRNTGSISGATTFARDEAFRKLKAAYKGYLTEEQISNLVYKDVFAEGWAGAPAPRQPSFGGGGGGSF